jgi:hypothetical protein
MHDDIESQIAEYRRQDSEKVKQLRAESLCQKRIWEYVNWPCALWIRRFEQIQRYREQAGK